MKKVLTFAILIFCQRTDIRLQGWSKSTTQ